MDWYTSVLKKYAVFEGRARRQEYWMFMLINVLIYFGLFIIAAILGAMADALGVLGSGIYMLYALAMLVPTLAVTVRRLHDTGRSGWWYLIALVPFVGGIILLIFTVLEGDAGNNAYGANPKIAA